MADAMQWTAGLRQFGALNFTFDHQHTYNANAQAPKGTGSIESFASVFRWKEIALHATWVCNMPPIKATTARRQLTIKAIATADAGESFDSTTHSHTN